MFIRCDNISKNYHLSLIDLAVSFFGNLLGRQNIFATNRVIKAVQDVSLRVNQGERLGIIGANGAGKTTLLRLIAGLMAPTSGDLQVEGHVNCVMTLGAGLHEDLPGRENIYIDGEIQGRGRREISEKIQEIIDFADLGEFIDYPVRTYSSGMKARLAFAMITHIEPEILIIDEALSVGDVNFNAKASARMKEMCDRGKIVIIVSHNMGAIEEMCNRCVWMDQGRIVMDGDPAEVTRAYLETVIEKEEAILRSKLQDQARQAPDGEAYKIAALQFRDGDQNNKIFYNVGEELNVCFTVQCSQPIAQPDFRLLFRRTDGIVVAENSALEGGLALTDLQGEAEIMIRVGSVLLGKGTYGVELQMVDASNRPEKILATHRGVIRVENFYYPYENPIFFHAVNWSVNQPGDKQ